MRPRSERISNLSAIKLALLARQTYEQSHDILNAEPIAVTGIGCRFPGGAENPEAFWHLLQNKGDGICEVPKDRWDIDAYYDENFASSGKMNTRRGGFLSQIDGFDAGFFGISSREAVRMDPQQRLLLEVIYEALEDAGLPHDRLSDSLTSVFVASYHDDYTHLQYSDPPSIDVRTLTGTLHSITANRISYLLDLHGPSVTVDTACSSSLVAVHLACQSLRNRESDISIVGGVSLMVTPETSVVLSKVGFLSPSGYCYTFDADADGFVRAEGCGVVVLQRLSEAVANGDKILAIIRGSAVNQDGRSTVLTAPNGLAQQAVIRTALERAGVAPEQISHVEAHGTGTLLGDPIEAEALAAVLGPQRGPEHRCALTSVKANFGHLEAAAGIAGLIKVVLSLQHEAIPGHLHFTRLNPHISLDSTPLFIPTEQIDWPAGAGPRYAGVSSFGVGGTNAHVVVAEAPQFPQAEPAAAAAEPDRAYLLPLSARSPQALAAVADAFLELLSRQGDASSLYDLCYTASLRRTHYECRLAVTGNSYGQMVERLKAAVESERRSPTPFDRRAAASAPKMAFVFSGQGPQWWAMGRELLEQEPVFGEVIQRCDELLRREAGWSLLAELTAAEDTSRLDQTEIAQPAIFALQIALDALWRSWGIVPEAVVGHSIGEVAAAYSAGALSLEESIRLVCHRGRLMQQATGQGRMASVELSPEAAATIIAPYGDRVSVAAVNSPTTTVLSGDIDAMEAVLAQIAQEGISYRNLKVDYAFHSAQMTTSAEQLAQALAGLVPQRARIPFYSTVTGQASDGLDLDAGYWRRNMRQPVRFADAIASLVRDDYMVFLELSPHPVLAGMVSQCLAAGGYKGTALASLRRYRPERDTLLQTLAELYAQGFPVNWETLYPNRGRHVSLPLYPWQRERYWLERQRPARPHHSQNGGGSVQTGEPSLLGRPLRSPAIQGILFQSQIARTRPAFLDDHRIFDVAIMPATGFLAMAMEAARTVWGSSSVTVEDLTIQEALELPEDGQHFVQLHFVPGEDQTASLRIFSSADQQTWTLHASGTLYPGLGEGQPAAVPALTEIQARCRQEVLAGEHYRQLAGQGIAFGPSFQGVAQLWRQDGEVLARVHLPVTLQPEADRYLVHPALLDAAIQPMAAAISAEGSDEVYLPIHLGAVHLHRTPGPHVWSHIQMAPDRPDRAETVACNVTLFDETGIVATIQDMHFKRANPSAMRRSVHSQAALEPAQWFCEIQWQPKPLTTQNALNKQQGQWLIFADHDGTGSALARHLRNTGRRVHLVYSGASYEGLAEDCWTIDPAQPDHFLRLLGEIQKSDTGSLDGVVYLWSLDLPPVSELEDPLPAQRFGVGSLLYLVQALAAAHVNKLSGLWLATRNAQPVTAQATLAVEQAPLWGMGGSLAMEQPELQPICIDLDPFGKPEQDSEQLRAEIFSADGEDQIAWRDAKRFVARLVHKPLGQAIDGVPAPLLQLEVSERGLLDDLQLKPLVRRSPGAGEVEIRVHATGMNFRDVLKALGQYPGEPSPLGDECAGEIVSVGPGVEGFQVGDRVVAVAAGAFRSYVIAQADLVAPLPDALSFVEAASLPIAFLTADFTLNHLARLQPGERVLIHAAAGGVGLAAVQLAQRVGAEVFATAGSPAKRAYLRTLGVSHVFDSRSLAFAEQIQAVTGGRGVDVVLNSLAGDFIPKSLAVLAPNGRFLEIGKTGIWTEEQVRALKPEAAYFPVFLGDQFREEPGLIRGMLRDLLHLLASGALTPLPLRTFPLEAAPNAFRFMAQARHIGKIVLTLPGVASACGPVRPDATYLITGGLGGLGQSLARWLAAQGARHLVLVGRSGAESGKADGLVNELEEAGVQVLIAKADVAVKAEVARLLAKVEAELPPLRGIIHAAGVVDDGILLQQNWERFSRVLAPKVSGGWNLHVLTQQKPLDFFVCFSAFAAVQGAAGQGNYTAANLFLDSLAHQRRAQGLPALSINWGPWGETGMAARLDRGDHSGWARQGLGVIPPEIGVQAFSLALAQPQPQLVVTPIAWDKLHQVQKQRPVWRGLVQQGIHHAPATTAKATAASTEQPEFLRRWAVTPPGQQRNLLLNFIRDEVIRTIGLSGDPQLDPRQPFVEIGLDSLMAVELRNSLSKMLDTPLPATLLFDQPTGETLAAYLMREVPALASITVETPLPSTAQAAKLKAGSREAVLAEVKHLSDEEAEALLLAELRGFKKGS